MPSIDTGLFRRWVAARTMIDLNRTGKTDYARETVAHARADQNVVRAEWQNVLRDRRLGILTDDTAADPVVQAAREVTADFRPRSGD